MAPQSRHVSKGEAGPEPTKASILPFISLDLPFALADYLERRGYHMPLDHPFPLDVVPSRVRHALLDEFKGRCPTVGEVAQISDSYWLATPAIGRKILQTIRAVTHASRPQADARALPQLTNAELLDRLESLREELQWLHAVLKARRRMASQRKDRFRRHAIKGSDPGGPPSSRDWPQTNPEEFTL
jgi:hypothetical protein